MPSIESEAVMVQEFITLESQKIKNSKLIPLNSIAHKKQTKISTQQFLLLKEQNVAETRLPPILFYYFCPVAQK